MKALVGIKKITYANIKNFIKKQQFFLIALVVFLTLAGIAVYLTQLLIGGKTTDRCIENKQQEVSLLAGILYRETNLHSTKEDYRKIFNNYVYNNRVVSIHIRKMSGHADSSLYFKIVNPIFLIEMQNYSPDLSENYGIDENSGVFFITEPIVGKWKEIIGYVTVVYNITEMHKKASPIIQEVSIILSILFGVLVVFFALLYKVMFIPLKKVIEIAHQVDSGNFSLRTKNNLSKLLRKSEFEELYAVFDSLVDKLEVYDAELHNVSDNMERNVAEKTDHLTKEINEKIEIEEELKRLNHTVGSIINASPLPIIALSVDFEVVDASIAVLNMFGYEPNEIIGRELSLIYHKDYNMLLDTLRANINNFEAVRTQVRGRNKNGNLMILKVMSTGMFYESQNIHGYLLILDDITEQLQLEKKSHENEMKFRTLIDEAVAGIVMLQSNNIIFVNSAAIEILEYPNIGELYKTPIEEIIAPEYRYKFYMLSENIELQSKKQEIEIITYYGARKIIEVGARTVDIEKETYLQITFLDITGEKKAKEELIRINKTLEERILDRTKQLNKTLLGLQDEVHQRTKLATALQAKSEILDSAASICIVYDKNGEVTYVTPYTLNTLKRKEEEMLGDKIWSIPHKLDTEHSRFEHAEIVTHFEKEKNVLNREELIAMARREMKLDDSSYILEVQVPSLGARYLQLKRSLGVGNTIIESGLDITEQILFKQKLEEALNIEKELGELKIQFVSMVSHEYRTPLTVILSSASVIKQAVENNRTDLVDKYIERINKSVKSMTQLVEDVLTFGKTASKRLADIKNINFPEFISNIIAEITVAYDYKTKVKLDFLDEIPIIRSDERALEHIIQNLVTNAIKYTIKEKDARVIISREGEKIKIVVADEGIGIPEKDIKNLFSGFHRASNVGDISGTGLGLSIVRQNVEALGGEIFVNSTVGVGTEFTVLLPMELSVH